MPITSNLINVAKGLGRSSFVRNKLQQGARTDIYKQIQESLKGLKTDAFSRMEGYAPLHSTEREAQQELANVHPPMARQVYDAAAQQHTEAKAAVQKFETDHAEQARQDKDLVALNRLKIKEKFGFQATGKEYARIKSLPALGEKHLVVKANLPVRGDQPVPQYIQGAHNMTKQFVDTLEERSPYVSPRLAAQGRDVKGLEKSMQQYKDAVKVFSYVDEEAEVSPAELLRDHSVNVKVLQDGKFRIQTHNPQVGRLTAKIKPGQDKPMQDHVIEGLEQAARVTDAIHQDSSHLSRKMLRNNFIQRHVDFKGLANFEKADEVLSNRKAEIDALKQQGVAVKVLRDGTFRITRFNDQDQAVKTRHLPLARHSDMGTHVQNGIIQAQALANQQLPEKIPFKQQFKNTFRPFKKAVLNAIN